MISFIAQILIHANIVYYVIKERDVFKQEMFQNQFKNLINICDIKID